MRLFRLDHFSYGLDEILQGYWIQGSWSFFWKSLRFDAVHPPLDYLVARGVEALGPADWARKLPDALWGTLTIPVLGLLVWRRAGALPGVVTALLLAFAPFHVRYSQEFRPYALGLFLLCLALLCLDRFLERPGAVMLIAVYLVTLAAAYALYLAAAVLVIAGLALLVDDSLSSGNGPRRRARLLLAASPLLGVALWLGYLPWWPVVLEAAKRPPAAARAAFTVDRVSRLLSFFLFAPDGDHPLKLPGLVFLLLVLAGAALCVARRGLRFLAVWGIGGLLAIEILGQLHPHYDFARRFLPAGMVFPAFAAIALAELLRRRRARVAAAALLLTILVLDAQSLAFYFREGRADWRPLANFLRTRPKSERIFTENQYSEMCVAFYVEGPQWMFRGGRMGRDVWNLDGEIVRLTWSWLPGSTAWMVLAGEPEHSELREWAKAFEQTPFPSAEGAVLVKLDPARRDAVFPPASRP